MDYQRIDYERPRLLLVQHDERTAAIIGFRLQLLGYEVISLDGSEDVQAVIDEQIPNLVLVDTRLTHIDGFELIVEIRTNELTASIPVLACSPDSSPQAIRRTFFAGANDYLILPFDPATLEHKVECLLTDSRTARERV